MDEKEFCRLVDGTKSIVLAAVRKYLPARYFQAIDDVVQETYIRVYRYMESSRFTDEKGMQNWIYTIAKNESLRMADKFHREEARALRLKSELESFGAGNEQPDPEEIEMLKKIIEELPVKYRTVFELLLQGRSETQISDALKIRRGTVKSRIHRGRSIIYRIATGREGLYE